MRRDFCWLFAAALCLSGFGPVQAAGPLVRVPNTSLKMPLNPPTQGYTWVNAFGNLTFLNPVAITSPPGETNQIFIAQRNGSIVVITNLTAPTQTTFMDISDRVLDIGDTLTYGEEGLLGLAFHPGYATNGYFYVFYTGNAVTTAGNGRHDILSRFHATNFFGTNQIQGDPASEVRMIVQYDREDNHNGGDLHFGPDGYLYVGLGDEGGAYGEYGNTQFIDRNFYSAIMRIDVDGRPGSLPPNPNPALPSLTNYFIPPDNPFVGASSFNGLPVFPGSVRTEFWAVGMRNPWRFSFDPVSGLLYCGHVGQDFIEWVDIVSKGSNPGWNFFEGSKQWTNSAQIPAGFVRTPPLIEYGHTNGRACVIGGIVYRGSRISQLYGSYLYADFISGEIWSLRNTGTNVTQNTVIMTDSSARICAFGVDPSNGDVLYAAQRSGINSMIKRIIYNGTTTGTPIPATLSAAGAFTNLLSLTPAPGVVPYDINVPFWSDNAIKSRWFSVPNTNLTIGFSREGNWAFPTGTVWIKHFDLELTNGVPSSRKRLETRFLVKNSNGVYGVTYRWGNSTNDAALVAEGGTDDTFVLDNGGGILSTQVWHYPSRGECLQCHTPSGGWALGANTPQMNRDLGYGATVTNQIAALSLAGYFNSNVSGLHTLRALAPATNSAVSLEYRVRSYLVANCVQCHQPGGLAWANWDARLSTITANAGLVNGPLINNSGDPNNRVLKPGSLANSMMFTRITSPNSLRMPPLGTSVLDTNAILLLSAWITNDLPSYQSFADWQALKFGSTNAPNAGSTADPDGDGASNYLEFLTSTDPLAATNFWSFDFQRFTNFYQIRFPQMANRGFEVQISTNLFGLNSWSPLDVAGNEPFFSISNRFSVINDSIIDVSNKFYRVRIFEP